MLTAGATPPSRRPRHALALSVAALGALLALAGPAQPADAPAKPAAAPPLPELRWEQAFYGQWQGHEALLYSSSLFYGKLTFGDLDGDGLPDLLVGKADGRIAWFRNVGTAKEARWHLEQENLTALRPSKEGEKSAASEVIETGGYAAPALVDIDQDGDLDLFVGTGDGRLMFYRNVGNARLPAFVLVTANFLGKGFGTHLVPVFADVDRNRSPDLFLGNLAGDVYLLVNQGTQRQAAFCVEFPRPDALPGEQPPCRPAPRRVASIAPENDAAPGVVDWDGDGDPDLFVGKSNGTIDYYQNKGTPTQPDWRLTQERFLAIDDGGFAAPAFLDVNGDGKPDLLVGSSTNNVSLYTYKDTGKPLDVWKVTGNALEIERFSRELHQTVVTAGDLDGDGDLDLMVGDRSGHLLWLENVGTRTRPAWRLKQDHLLAGTVRENAAPCLVDIDGDGDLDLLVGGSDGRVWLMRNVGTSKEARFTLETTNYAGIDVGADSVPVAFDIDGDGKPDLFVGNRRGQVVFYRNEGTRREPDFRLAKVRFGEFTAALRAVPAFFDVDGDGKPDLVIGSRKGDLALLLNRNDNGAAELKNWKPGGEPWGAFRTAGYSAPLFVDLDGDGKPDLLLGDADGNVQLWFNRGAQTAGPAEQAVAAAGAAQGAAPAPAGQAPVQPMFESQSGLMALAEPAPGSAFMTGAPGSGLVETVRTGPLTPIFKLASSELGGLKFKGRVRPTFADLNGDGRIDLVVGTAEGKLVYYRNEGSKAEPKFVKADDNLGGFNTGGNPSPLLYDLDGDGLVDLIVGTEGGRVLFYRNTGTKTAPAFTLDKEALAAVSVSRYAAPAVGLVRDGTATELVVGDFAGNLWLFARVGGAQSLNFKLVDRRFLGVDVGVAATPFIGDIDNDDKPDMLVGSDQGRVSLFQRVKADAKHPQGWAPGPDVFQGVRFPPGSSPRLVDIDGDGDMDLMVGSEKGTIYFYRNDALNPPSGPSQ
jgi:large repetitive protein